MARERATQSSLLEVPHTARIIIVDDHPNTA